MAGAGGFGTPPPPPPPSAGAGGQISPRRLGDILSAAFDVYKAHVASLITIVAPLAVVLSLFNALIAHAVHAARIATTTVNGQIQLNVSPGSAVAVGLGALAAAAVVFVLTFVVEAAVARAAAQATLGETVVPAESLRWGFRRLGSVLLIAILAALAIFVGLLLLIIPGLIVAVMLAVAIPALVFEDRRGGEALRRSWELVKGSFWHVLGTIIVTALITGVVAGIFDAFAGGNWFLYWILDAAARTITIPFNALVIVLLYLDLRARKEILTADTLRSEIAHSA